MRSSDFVSQDFDIFLRKQAINIFLDYNLSLYNILKSHTMLFVSASVLAENTGTQAIQETLIKRQFSEMWAELRNAIGMVRCSGEGNSRSQSRF